MILGGRLEEDGGDELEGALEGDLAGADDGDGDGGIAAQIASEAKAALAGGVGLEVEVDGVGGELNGDVLSVSELNGLAEVEMLVDGAREEGRADLSQQVIAHGDAHVSGHGGGQLLVFADLSLGGEGFFVVLLDLGALLGAA